MHFVYESLEGTLITQGSDWLLNYFLEVVKEKNLSILTLITKTAKFFRNLLENNSIFILWIFSRTSWLQGGIGNKLSLVSTKF